MILAWEEEEVQGHLKERNLLLWYLLRTTSQKRIRTSGLTCNRRIQQERTGGSLINIHKLKNQDIYMKWTLSLVDQ